MCLSVRFRDFSEPNSADVINTSHFWIMEMTSLCISNLNAPVLVHN